MPTPRHYPALDLSWPSHPGTDAIDRLLAAIDDCAPSAVEDTPRGVRIFFTDISNRDRAALTASTIEPSATRDLSFVSDDAWAERSQASLEPVRVERVIVSPPWIERGPSQSDDVWLAIQPSMGFGTGHHASTRLCLRLLQTVGLDGRKVIDVGTGSGVLAIAASRFGARRVLAIDYDLDALTSARENLDLNGATGDVELRPFNLSQPSPDFSERFDVLFANLTGAMLRRFAPTLAEWVVPEGSLVVSGFQEDEELETARAFEAIGFAVAARHVEDGWVAMELRALPAPRRPEHAQRDRRSQFSP